jgi:hypothetical protein
MMLLRLQTLSSILTMNTSDDDRERLAELTRNVSAQVCLPCDMTDESLASLASDLRSLQGEGEVDGEDLEAFERIVNLLCELFFLQSEKLTGQRRARFPLGHLDHWVGRLNYYAQREIVSRVNKQPCPRDMANLLAELSVHVLTTRTQ